MSRARTLSLIFVVAQPVSAAAVTANSEETTMTLRAGERTLEAQLGSSRVTGAEVSLTRHPGRILGKVFNSTADLTWQKGRVRGRLGAHQVFVDVWQRGTGFQLNGRVGRAPIELRVSATRILGEVGGCEYALVAAGARYEGWRDCGGLPVPVPTTVQLPEALKDSSDAEAAALLILFMRVDPLPPGPPDAKGETIRNPNE